MTNEKAISIIKNAFSWYEDNARESEEEDWSGQHEALDLAIKALEQQPTHGSTYGGVSWGGTYKEEAQPTDAVSREAVFHLYKTFWRCFVDEANADIFMNAIRDLPSVKPERPKGKWIKVITHKDDFGETWHFKCSICGEKSNKGYRPLENYCHNCGAEMGGAND